VLRTLADRMSAIGRQARMSTIPAWQIISGAVSLSLLLTVQNISGVRVAIIRPFNALRPRTERAPQVAAVPYDVVNTEEARAPRLGKPLELSARVASRN